MVSDYPLRLAFELESAPMADFVVCEECWGKGERLKPYTPKAVVERCPKCGGTGLVHRG